MAVAAIWLLVFGGFSVSSYLWRTEAGAVADWRRQQRRISLASLLAGSGSLNWGRYDE